MRFPAVAASETGFGGGEARVAAETAVVVPRGVGDRESGRTDPRAPAFRRPVWSRRTTRARMPAQPVEQGDTP